MTPQETLSHIIWRGLAFLRPEPLAEFGSCVVIYTQERCGELLIGATVEFERIAGVTQNMLPAEAFGKLSSGTKCAHTYLEKGLPCSSYSGNCDGFRLTISGGVVESVALSSPKPLPLYTCHKQVRAVKIKEVVCHAHADPAVSIEEFAKTPEFTGGHIFPVEEGYAPIPFDAEYFRKHQPQAGGYYVVYEDGYCSYSPAAAFESGYTRV